MESHLTLNINYNHDSEDLYSDDFWELFTRACDWFLRDNIALSIKNSMNLELDLSLESDETIQGLNLEHRGKDKTTDVLSFPVYEDFKVEIEELPELGICHLGDIFISVPQCERQAKGHEVDSKSEMYHLAVHGFLHLLGFDHEINEEQDKIMREKEQEILNRISELKLTFSS